MPLNSPSSPIINQPKTWCSGCAVPKDRSSSAWPLTSALRLLLLRLLIASYLLLSHAPTTAAGPIQHNCTGGSYAGNSAFQANLNALLASLAFRSSSSNSANTTSGAGPDRTYGVYLCEGDLTDYDCQACIKTAATDIIQSCPSARQAIIWYDYCLLRYSDANFFGVPDTNGFSMVNKNENTSSPVPFQAVANLVQAAPYSSQPLMFASNASAAGSLYAMAQCTADLGSDGCRTCLTTILAGIKACCTGFNGWRYLAASCWIRYENTPFFLELNGTYTEIINHQCSNQPASLATSGLIKNFLSDVASKARATGFYNATTTAGEGPARLYGLALCRADLPTPSDNCTNCLNEARIRITGDNGCPNMTQGTVWYEKCLLRYSNQSFFGVVDDGGRTYCGLQPVTEAVSNATFAAASSVVGVAASSPLLFGAEQARVSDSQSSYLLAQCTRDLGSGGCRSCLEKGMGMVASNCTQVNGWRYLSGSCTIRYEDFAFFNTTSVILSPGAPPPQPTSPGPGEEGGGSKSSSSLVAEIVAPILGVILLGSLLYYLWRRSKRRHDRSAIELEVFRPLHGKDIPFMDLAIIQAATSNFSDANKLGEGGFGPVYKGVLQGGQEIAVKRLSTKSNQGATEFKNEVKLIAKVQHKNLVRMLGYCVEKKEKLLIYEYLPNRSLDIILFDPNKRSELDWRRRHHIVAGIARGLLYLHEDSLLKVIHRDLKASNVLLDKGMNPKISDFGMAKIFEADENEAANTSRVVGTYGYMAPEYAMDGVFSVKSDAYSFGVLLLEIISGQKNGRSHFVQHGGNLPRIAWHLWSEGKALELMDPVLGDSYPADEAQKLIHIGLLCVQENAEERPTMSSVVLMLQSEKKVPQPTQPPTFSRVSDLSSSSTKNTTNSQSINEVTISDTAPR